MIPPQTLKCGEMFSCCFNETTYSFTFLNDNYRQHGDIQRIALHQDLIVNCQVTEHNVRQEATPLPEWQGQRLPLERTGVGRLEWPTPEGPAASSPKGLACGPSACSRRYRFYLRNCVEQYGKEYVILLLYQTIRNCKFGVRTNLLLTALQ